jgi:hypothetical protein
MKKTTMTVKVKPRKSKMTKEELAEYYAHGRGYTRVADTTKRYRRNRDKRAIEE